jgi:DNA-binding transcriptional ArsR family regulator
MEMTDALAALAALGHPTRLAVYRRLVKAGVDGCMAGDLAQEIGVPAATMSFHYKELTRAGLIQAQQQGRFVCYRANFPRMTELLVYLTENCCAGSDVEACPPSVVCAPAKTVRS